MKEHASVKVHAMEHYHNLMNNSEHFQTLYSFEPLLHASNHYSSLPTDSYILASKERLCLNIPNSFTVCTHSGLEKENIKKSYKMG